MNILMVTGVEGARNLAQAAGVQLGMEIQVAEGRRDALTALRKQEYAVVVLDETIAECDPAGMESIWERSGLAIPLQINFALSGAARIVREIRSALHRREREELLARRAATAVIESELNSAVAGLLLNSQLALAEREVPVAVAEKLRVMANLAGNLRQRLSTTPDQRRSTTAAR